MIFKQFEFSGMKMVCMMDPSEESANMVASKIVCFPLLTVAIIFTAVLLAGVPSA